MFATSWIQYDTTRLYSSFLRAKKPRKDGMTAVILHGAGSSSSARHEGLAQLFAAQGISVIALDFLGHGMTGGKVQESSLSLRHEHARAAIQHWTDKDTPLIVCGFSMSGHTALQLSDTLAGQVQSLGLFAPATYSVKAENVQFGPKFTEILHRSSSWQESHGLKVAKKFRGRAVIVLGSEDEVIPQEVASEILRALQVSSKEAKLELLEGVGHLLARYLSEQTVFSNELIEYLSRGDI